MQTFKDLFPRFDGTPLPDLIIYHGGCPDGLGGAWAFYDMLQKDKSKFFPGSYKKSLPDVTGKHVIFVDFSCKVDDMLYVLDQAKSVIVIDHHESTKELISIMHTSFTLLLDMDRSGAQMAWDFVNPGKPRPWFINDIGDRDLWQNKYPNSVEVTRALSSCSYYDSLDAFAALPYQQRSMMLSAGSVLVHDDQRTYKQISYYATDCIFTSLLNNKTKWKCRVVSAELNQASHVGALLCKDKLCHFAVVWYYDMTNDSYGLSLRASTDTNVDLTKIVKHMGYYTEREGSRVFKQSGGGHKKACGSSLSGKHGQTIRNVFVPVDEKSRFYLLNEPLNDVNAEEDITMDYQNTVSNNELAQSTSKTHIDKQITKITESSHALTTNHIKSLLEYYNNASELYVMVASKKLLIDYYADEYLQRCITLHCAADYIRTYINHILYDHNHDIDDNINNIPYLSWILQSDIVTKIKIGARLGLSDITLLSHIVFHDQLDELKKFLKTYDIQRTHDATLYLDERLLNQITLEHEQFLAKVYNLYCAAEEIIDQDPLVSANRHDTDIMYLLTYKSELSIQDLKDLLRIYNDHVALKNDYNKGFIVLLKSAEEYLVNYFLCKSRQDIADSKAESTYKLEEAAN
jgi:oligoribonuclease NrnB/cAMP/cGMP phosphodiesterase (DHH superfamily)